MSRTGGIRTDRTINEKVYFHPDNAIEMVQYILPHIEQGKKLKTLDACSGSGNLGKAFDFWIDNCTVDYVEFDDGNDILETFEKYDVIICNPEWSIKKSLPIYWHLIRYCMKPNAVLFFIINNVFCYQGSDRAEILEYQKYYFLPRWTFKHAERPFLIVGFLFVTKTVLCRLLLPG